MAIFKVRGMGGGESEYVTSARKDLMRSFAARQNGALSSIIKSPKCSNFTSFVKAYAYLQQYRFCLPAYSLTLAEFLFPI